MMTLYWYSCSEVWKFMIKWVQKMCLGWLLLKEINLEISERTNMKGCRNVKKKKVQATKTERTKREKKMFLFTNRMTLKEMSDLGDETPSMAEKGETLQPLLSGFFITLVFMLGTQRQKKLKVAYESVWADWPCSVSCLSQVCPLLVCLRLGLQSVFVSSTLVYLGCASTPVLCQTFVHVPLIAVYLAVRVGSDSAPIRKCTGDVDVPFDLFSLEIQCLLECSQLL